jgi:ABC-type transporter Mla MlaB component
MEPPAISSNESGAFVLALEGRVDRACIPALCDSVREALDVCPDGLLICDLAKVVDPGAATVDALARAQLAAKRVGGRVTLRGADVILASLLDLMGLGRVLPIEAGVVP